MAQAYTPGLRIAEYAVLRRERRLPLRGEVVVSEGDVVEPDTIVARTELPGEVQTLNLAARLGVDAAQVPATLTRPVGASVVKGEVLAAGSSLFGLVRNTVEAPADGVVESVSHVTGQLILREPPVPVTVNAYVHGVVAGVLPGEGVVVECRGAFLQGIFGVGGETAGRIVPVVGTREDVLRPEMLRADHAGAVVIGGAHVSYETLARARDLGVAAVVAGGLDDLDLRRLLGRDLGVAITGTENLDVTLILTEGFGRIPMAARTWRLLEQHAGEIASVSGATQIRAGVMRPEILIAQKDGAPGDETRTTPGLERGALLRVIRAPFFGRIGTVVDLPAELQRVESEALVRVVVVEFADDGSREVVPRANVELIAS